MSKDENKLFEELDRALHSGISNVFFSEPPQFRSLVEVIKANAVLGTKGNGRKNSSEEQDSLMGTLANKNPAYADLLKQRELVHKTIEEIIKCQHGSLNNSVDTMSEVLLGYTKCREDVRALRVSLHEIRTVLSSKRPSAGVHADLRGLWLQNRQLEYQLRIIANIHSIREAPSLIEKLVTQKRFLTAAKTVNKSLANTFSEDLTNVEGLTGTIEILVELKARLIELLVLELRRVVTGAVLGNKGRLSVTVLVMEGNERVVLTFASQLSVLGPRLEGDNIATSNGRSRAAGLRGANASIFGDFDGGVNTPGGTNTAGSWVEGSEGDGASGAVDLEDLGLSASWLDAQSQMDAGVTRHSDTHHYDLLELDEEKELEVTQALLSEETVFDGEPSINPSTPSLANIGNLYVKLLVRAATELKCEDDVERLMLEDLHDNFRGLISDLRLQAISRGVTVVTSAAGTDKGGEGRTGAAGEEGKGVPETKSLTPKELFVSYTRSLYSCVVSIFARVISVYKLLHMSKRLQSADKTRSNSTATSMMDAYEGVGGGGKGGSVVNDGVINGSLFQLSNQNLKSILSVWADIEDLVTAEVMRHFLDMQINANLNVTISDFIRPRLLSEDLGASSSTILGTGLTQNGGTENNTQILSLEATVCTPSSTLAAAVYNDTEVYSEVMKGLLGRNTTANQSQGLPVSGRRENMQQNQQHVSDSKILRALKLFIESELLPTVQSQANDQVRDHIIGSVGSTSGGVGIINNVGNQFLSKSVLLGPGFGGGADPTERADKAPSAKPNTAKASASVLGKDSGVVGGGNSGSAVDGLVKGAGNVKVNKEGLSVCPAASTLYTLMPPLVTYWIQLPSYHNQMSTVLNRTIRSYVTAAREELISTVVNRLFLTTEQRRKCALVALKGDPTYHRYIRIGPIGDFLGRSTRSGHASAALTATSSSREPSSPTGIEELDSWTSLWDLALISNNNSSSNSGGGGYSNSKKYPIGGDSQPNHEAIYVAGLTMSVAHGSQWLANQLLRTVRAIRRLGEREGKSARKQGMTSRHNGGSAGQGVNGSERDNQSVVSGATPFTSVTKPRADNVSSDGSTTWRIGGRSVQNFGRDEDLESRYSEFVMMIETEVEELVSVTDEAVSLLRSELQALCFYYLHPLAKLNVQAIKPRYQTQNTNKRVDTPSTTGSGGLAGKQGDIGIQQNLSTGHSAISNLHQHLLSLVSTGLKAAPAPLLAATLTPLMQLIPRLLIKCAMCAEKEAFRERQSAIELANLMDYLQRSVLACQQNVILLLQHCNLPVDIEERLVTMAGREFERTRRFINALANVPTVQEIKGLIASSVRSNEWLRDAQDSSRMDNQSLRIYDSQGSTPVYETVTSEFTKDELNALWDIRHRSPAEVERGASGSVSPTTKSQQAQFSDVWYKALLSSQPRAL